MSRRMLWLLAALLIAAGTTLLTQRWLSRTLAGAAHAAPVTARVLVAARDLTPGTIVDAAALRWARWPGDASAGLVVAGGGTLESFVGAVVRIAMVAGEPVTAARLVQPGDRSAMAAVLAPGARAVTIAVNAASGLAGFLVPGDRVDVILTQTLPAGADGSPERHASSTVLRDLRILGTDASSGASEPAIAAVQGAARLGQRSDGPIAPATVTLETSPKGAELIAVAGELGKLSLSLRALRDGGPAGTSTPTWDHDATLVLPPRNAAVARTTTAAVAPARPTTAATSSGIDVVRGIATPVAAGARP